jgi:hypothetical protein
VEGALIDHVETGFITMHQREGGGFRQALKGGGDASDGGSGRVGSGGGFSEQMGLDGPGAAGAPPGGDHFLDQAELEAIDGLETLDVMSEDGLKGFRRFVVEDQAAGQEAVAQGILGGCEFARSGDRTLGAGTVDAGGIDSSEGRHKKKPKWPRMNTD